MHTATVPFTSHGNVHNYAKPKPFSWAKHGTQWIFFIQFYCADHIPSTTAMLLEHPNHSLQYVTLQDCFSHLSLVIYFFPARLIKLKPRLPISGTLLITNQVYQSPMTLRLNWSTLTFRIERHFTKTVLIWLKDHMETDLKSRSLRQCKEEDRANDPYNRVMDKVTRPLPCLSSSFHPLSLFQWCLQSKKIWLKLSVWKHLMHKVRE
jgi:hypothetical protein